MTFEIQIMNDVKQILKAIQRVLQGFRDEKKGPTMVTVQSCLGKSHDKDSVTELVRKLNFSFVCRYSDFGVANAWSKWLPTGHISHQRPRELVRNDGVAKNRIQVHDSTFSQFGICSCGHFGSVPLFSHPDRYAIYFDLMRNKMRLKYFFILGNLPADATLFGADLFYGRHLLKNNFVLWCSQTELPDLGGREADDNRLLTDFDESSTSIANQPGCYSSVTIELDIDALAVNTLLQSHHVNDIEGFLINPLLFLICVTNCKSSQKILQAIQLHAHRVASGLLRYFG